MASPKATAATAASTSSASSDKGKAKETAPAGPVVGGTAGDWSAVWNQERNAYYFWNRKTGITTWDNPLESKTSEDAPAKETSEDSTDNSASSAKADGVDEAAATSKDQASTSAPAPTATSTSTPTVTPKPDFEGIDPDLAYLDPSLAARAGGGASAYVARFNARTGRFEGDPTRNPNRVAEHERAKRQNGHYFDVDNWEKTLALQQEQARKRGASELEADDGEYGSRDAKRLPSKKEMKEIRERNKEKKEKKQKGWLMG